MEITLITDRNDGTSTSMKSVDFAIAGGKLRKVNHVTYIEFEALQGFYKENDEYLQVTPQL